MFRVFVANFFRMIFKEKMAKGRDAFFRDLPVVVGGFPNPIGGVTSFIARLAADNRFCKLIDFYPSDAKLIPSSYRGTVVYLRGLPSLFLYFVFWVPFIPASYFFNFSTSRSLLFFAFCPKFSGKWALMLHHGNLDPIFSYRFTGFLLRNFDSIYCINKSHKDFYLKAGVPVAKLKESSSYVPPFVGNIDIAVKAEIDAFLGGGFTLVASGYPSKIYNHNWCIDYVREHGELKLALFLYGNGDNLDNILLAASACPRIKVFWSVDQLAFNYALSLADVYLRPTQRDGFGVAVADAVSFGVPVLASNVCKRYPGTRLFEPTSYDVFSKELSALIAGNSTAEIASADGFHTFSFGS